MTKEQMAYTMFWIGFITICIIAWKVRLLFKEFAWEKELDKEYKNYLDWYEYFNEEVED